jgi:two-component system chemotaxis sensor kinase CheA
MRIPTYKVDNLVDMMGELIIIQSLIEQEASQRFDTNDVFINNISRMSRITKDIQNVSMGLRMVSLKSTFQKILRIGRDTITQLNKDVAINIKGDETEIDRNVADKILDPLVHIVKNYISHGIESKDERISKGKSEQGQITIEAYNSRGSVYIEISDDGRGISRDKVYNKALEKYPAIIALHTSDIESAYLLEKRNKE